MWALGCCRLCRLRIFSVTVAAATAPNANPSVVLDNHATDFLEAWLVAREEDVYLQHVFKIQLVVVRLRVVLSRLLAREISCLPSPSSPPKQKKEVESIERHRQKG